jgi:hypothetical protein
MRKALVALALVVSVASCGGDDDAGTATTSKAEATTVASSQATPTSGSPSIGSPSTETPTSAPSGGGLTMDVYNSISNGMSEEEVLAITGPCEKTSETNVAGHTSAGYNCEGAEPFSAVTLIFSDGKLVSKSQFGLDGGAGGGEAKGSMTKAKFDQIQLGQSSADVQAVTGPCVKASETNIAGHESFTLTCYASDGFGNAFLLFTDDKLMSKSQFGLE